jgi:hypothetical protein
MSESGADTQARERVDSSPIGGIEMSPLLALVMVAIPPSFGSAVRPAKYDGLAGCTAQIAEKRRPIVNLLIGNTRIAADQFQEFVVRNPENRLALAGWIVALTNLDESQEAVDACDRYLRASNRMTLAST